MTLERVIDWQKVLTDATDVCERRFGLFLVIDADIVGEIAVQANSSLAALNMNTMPNVAKVAGHVAFWIRKLKPVFHGEGSANKLLTINEVVGILVGVGICRRYFDEKAKKNFTLPDRIMKDWSMSLRNHSHSPHSCAISFEFLASEQ